MRVGVDSGGTFTDVLTDGGQVLKVPSTPADPGEAVRRGVAAVTTGRPEVLAHGTTVATNALLEGTGAAVALVTTEGLGDVIEIARQDRPSLYDASVAPPPRSCHETGGSRSAGGWRERARTAETLCA